MTRLGPIRVEAAPAWQRQRLARWLAEWQLERRLREGDPPPFASGQSRPPAGVGAAEAKPAPGLSGAEPAATDGSVRIGQIRLMKPDLAGGECRPLFVAVLRETPEAGLLVAPFGRFAEPATPGELLTGRDRPPLRVLCLWSARWLCPTLVERSWTVDALTATELGEALSVWSAIAGAAPLPAELEERVGPPIVHPADPRHEYRAEEMTIMSALAAAAAEAWESPGNAAWDIGTTTAEWRLAAESREVYGRSIRHRNPQQDPESK
jgi:hypothetical protein